MAWLPGGWRDGTYSEGSRVECTCTRTCSTPAAILKLGRALPTAHLQCSVRVPADTCKCRPCISSDAGVQGQNGGQEWRHHLKVEAKALFRTGARLTGAKKACADERSINAMLILIPMCVCCILCLPMLGHVGRFAQRMPPHAHQTRGEAWQLHREQQKSAIITIAISGGADN